MIIELFGMPGAGKSYLLKKIISRIDNKKKIFNYQKFFFKKYLIKNQNTLLDKLFTKLYYYYVKRNYLKSNFIFKKNYNQLLNKIKLYNFKNYIELIENYKILLEYTPYSKDRKERLINNFLIEIISYEEKKIINFDTNEIILTDQGFYQKCFLNFKDLKDKHLIKSIKKYIKYVPIIHVALFINTEASKSIYRTKNRNYGFKYYLNDLKYLQEYKSINNYIIESLNDKKIELIKFKSSDLSDKEFNLISKKIN